MLIMSLSASSSAASRIPAPAAEQAPTVLITRPAHQAEALAALLEARGFQPVRFPTIAIRPIRPNPALDEALAHLADYAWVVLTSVNGVRVVWEAAEAVGAVEALRQARVAAIGPKTAQALRERGVTPAFVPQEYIAEAILPGLGDLRGQQVLLLRARQARPALRDLIRQAGGSAHEVPVYDTLPAQPDLAGVEALRRGVDFLTFTSPSTARNFVALARQAGLEPLNLPGHPKVVCIGPITAQAASEAGFEVAAVAAPYTAEGLVEAIHRLHRRPPMEGEKSA